jgi:hypothetical protein
MEKVAQEKQAMDQEPPLAQYVDAAYVTAEKLALAEASGRPLIGPAQPAPRLGKRFTTEDFTVNLAQRQAVCPAGQTSPQCSRLAIQATGKINFRFEWGRLCADCSLRGQCCGAGQKHRSLLVGQYHDFLQARRKEQKTEAFRLSDVTLTHFKNDPQKLAIAARLRRETTLTLKAIAIRVELGSSKSANTKPHDWMSRQSGKSAVAAPIRRAKRKRPNA